MKKQMLMAVLAGAVGLSLIGCGEKAQTQTSAAQESQIQDETKKAEESKDGGQGQADAAGEKFDALSVRIRQLEGRMARNAELYRQEPGEIPIFLPEYLPSMPRRSPGMILSLSIQTALLVL